MPLRTSLSRQAGTDASDEDLAGTTRAMIRTYGPMAVHEAKVRSQQLEELGDLTSSHKWEQIRDAITHSN
jgi:hypothetical protein